MASPRISAIALDDATFAAEIGKRVPPGEAPAEALERLHVGDIYLALACAAGSPASSHPM